MNAIDCQLKYLYSDKEYIVSYDNGQYYLTETDDFLDDSIVEIIELGETFDYVYDIETDDGTFGSGVGSLIVKNTDSVFCCYKGLKENIDINDNEKVMDILNKCYKIGDEMTEIANKIFKDPIKLEFEKIYLPWFSFGKKRYAGILYEPGSTKGVLDTKGIVLKRRDNAPITKKVYGGILDIFFSKGKDSLPSVLDFLEDQLYSILNNEIDIKDLTVSKTYKDCKSANIPHKVVAEKMKVRDPGNAPNFNERVPYVFIETKNNGPQYEKAEHPEYVIKNNLKLDGLYYMDQLRNPVTDLLNAMMSKKQIDDLFDKHKRKYILRKKGQPTLDLFLKKK